MIENYNSDTEIYWNFVYEGILKTASFSIFSLHIPCNSAKIVLQLSI